MKSYEARYATDRFYFVETPFDSLMQKRIIEVLLICSKYDRFMLEEDGRIDEQLFQEYVSLNLRYPPRFTEVSSVDEALDLLSSRHFDLIITMLNFGENHALEIGQRIKQNYAYIPMVVLTRYGQRINERRDVQDLSFANYVFSWLGNANIMLAIVKLIEDRMNVDHDVTEVGVQTIILVENSVRYYSSYLPDIYRILFVQARELMREGLNEHQQTLRMRGRPKILLATNFEEAIDLYERYRGNLLGVISDIAYERNGELDPQAGLVLSEHIRHRDAECPILLQSSKQSNAPKARLYDAAFIFKHSKTLLQELRDYIRVNYGFGDFIFRHPDTLQEAARAHNLVELQRRLREVPEDVLTYHVNSHHFSKWLKARALYSLANLVRPVTLKDFDSIEGARAFLVDSIKNFRMHVGRGTIARFDKDTFDEYSVFQRIGEGSLGGKARGIAFINTFLKRNRVMFRFDATTVQIPKTLVLTTEIFDQFMEDNALYDVSLSDVDDETLLSRFLEARLPASLVADLQSTLKVMRKPLAVRSSSLLEDSYAQPFAGIYATFFTPNGDDDEARRLRHLCAAIKGVMASTYARASKSYLAATHNLIDEEKMAVILQEVTGRAHGDLYYPSLSGVARSINFYPMGRERPDEGVASVAVGLGKTIVDGGVSLRFSPAHPKKIMQLSDVDTALQSTQQDFFAINLNPESFAITTDEAYNLVRADIQDHASVGSLKLLLSTYDFQNHRLRHRVDEGRKVVTFAPVLRYGMYPLAEILQILLEIGSEEMGVPVEIEFAVELDPEEDLPPFKFLQIRPIVAQIEGEELHLDEVDRDHCLLHCSSALGNGSYEGICDLVYVRPEGFDPARTPEIVRSIRALNQRLIDEKRPFVLIGPGRWGSSDPWLGVPVKWNDISQARVIVEASLKGFHVEPSQGSHFFQNLTSFGVAYLTVNPALSSDLYDVPFLDAQPALQEDDLVRLLRFDRPVRCQVDGRQRDQGVKAILYKPGLSA